MEVVKADAGKAQVAEATKAEVAMVEVAMDERPEHIAHRSPHRSTQKHASRRTQHVARST